jgi:hypothetical protein
VLPLRFVPAEGTIRCKGVAVGVSMKWSLGRSASRAAEFPFSCLGLLLATVCAAALAACTPDGRQGLAAGQPRGATVAFESIDGPPPGQFHRLVQNLNDEAQARGLAVISRETPSAYRVRGYLAAAVVKDETTISWVWDVFDGDEHRAIRISGEEAAKNTYKNKDKGRHRDVWNAADDAMLQRIARSSVAQLAAFLTSSEVAPGTPSVAQVAVLGASDSSPEAAGIFRIFQPSADPVAAETAEAPAVTGDSAIRVPLPRRKPASDDAVSALETVTLSAASH